MNPFAAKFFVPDSHAKRQAALWKESRPEDAKLMEYIAAQPMCIWLGDWNKDLFNDVKKIFAAAQDELPVFVLYNIPNRDVGQYSKGGAAEEHYIQWIEEFIQAVTKPCVVILEPDAVTHLSWLDGDAQQRRIDLLKQAIMLFKQAGIPVYLDAGNPFFDPNTIAQHIKVCEPHGFAVNVSNFYTTQECIAYGEGIASVTGLHFVIDTSRNGLGTYVADEPELWCNPPGRALGTPPTAQTGHPLLDAFLWVKIPGESDGTCRGGPKAGEWWPEYTLDLAKRTR